MKITIKSIWGILVCSVVISGLAACSSSPSPWSQSDDSPWKSKRTAEAETVPSDEFINAIPMEDAAPMEEEPAVEAGGEAWPYTPPPEPVEEPPVMVETMAEPVVQTGSNEDWVRGLPATDYAVQLYAGRVLKNVTRYQETHGLEKTSIVKTDRGDGDTIYVLIHVESDKAAAKQYAADAENKTGSGTWIRSVGGLQKITAQ